MTRLGVAAGAGCASRAVDFVVPHDGCKGLAPASSWLWPLGPAVLGIDARTGQHTVCRTHLAAFASN